VKRIQRTGLALTILLLICSAVVVEVSGRQQPQMPAKAAQSFSYAQREETASPRIRILLQRLRGQIKQKKLTFSVGYTTALDRQLGALASTRLPQNLSYLAEKQNSLARQLLAIDIGARDAFNEKHPNILPELTLRKERPVPCGQQTAFDWRKLGKVTPVLDQGSCGSCWDFSAVAAFEGSYLLRNGTRIDASEQQILSCSKAGTCGGGWPYLVFEYLIANGTAMAASYPYTATDSPCNTPVALPYRAVAWGYVDSNGGIPSVQALKNALCLHGPLSITVYVDTLFQAYAGGVFKDIPSATSPDINHAITLIGWDDSKQAWLIKNSWGTGWGETGGYGTSRGYMWIDYDTNKVGMASAWVDAQNRFYSLPSQYFKLLPKIRPLPNPRTLK